MKTLKDNCILLSILLASTTLIHSCCEAECDESDYSARIRLLSKADSTDLFFGPNSIYQVDMTKYFALSGEDTLHLVGYGTLDYSIDTVLFVDFGRDVDTAYFQYEDGDIDTFHLPKTTTYSKCCGLVTQINQIGLNDDVLTENNFPFVTLYK